MSIPRLGFATLATLAGLAGCSVGTGPSRGQQVTLSVVAGDLTPGTAPAAAPDSITLGGHTLVFEQVELVLKEIRLKRVEGTQGCVDDDQDHDDVRGAAAARSSDDDDEGDDDDHCEQFVVGPMLLDLPLGPDPARIVTVQVDTGSYREVEFKIHKPENDEGDDAFLQAHPELRKVSIRARGRFDGKPFSYVTELTAEQKQRLDPPLVVTEQTATNLTLVVDIRAWFQVSGALIDPITAAKGQLFDSAVRENIKRSFRVFEDRDRNGEDDDGDDD